jgi:Sulfotransferase family
LPDRATDPVLLHVGYHRTATSWLQKNVFADQAAGFGWTGKKAVDHPVRQVISLRWSEFDADALRGRFDELIEPIRAGGHVPVVSFERLSGHAASGGHDSAQIAERLKAVFPEARVLVVMREQRSAILSNYKMYVKAGGAATLRDFLVPATTPNRRLPTFDFEFFEYHHLLERYRRLFGAENVLALLYEQFVEDARSYVRSIATFAGRPPADSLLDSLPYGESQHGSPSTSELRTQRVLNHFIRSELNPTPALDLRRRNVLRKLARGPAAAMLTRGRSAQRLEEALRDDVEELVGDRYRDSNRRIAELTQIDVARYGWMV